MTTTAKSQPALEQRAPRRPDQLGRLGRRNHEPVDDELRPPAERAVRLAQVLGQIVGDPGRNLLRQARRDEHAQTDTSFRSRSRRVRRLGLSSITFARRLLARTPLAVCAVDLRNRGDDRAVLARFADDRHAQRLAHVDNLAECLRWDLIGLEADEREQPVPSKARVEV